MKPQPAPVLIHHPVVADIVQVKTILVAGT